MTSFLRTTMFYAVAIAAAVLFAWQPVWAEEDDLDTQLTLCTFKLSNPGSTATVFFLTRPDPKHADRTQFILVTAEHVFSRMKGEEATLALRKRQPDGQYVKSPLVLKVRSGGKPLWTRHPAADVAVMAVSPPPGVLFPHLGLDILARDEDLRKCEIHPGDTLHCVGYPHPNEFEANAAGFPVTRSGCIASFPLLPTDKTKGFLLDFNTFEGDSGAPVYLAEDHRGSRRRAATAGPAASSAWSGHKSISTTTSTPATRRSRSATAWGWGTSFTPRQSGRRSTGCPVLRRTEFIPFAPRKTGQRNKFRSTEWTLQFSRPRALLESGHHDQFSPVAFRFPDRPPGTAGPQRPRRPLGRRTFQFRLRHGQRGRRTLRCRPGGTGGFTSRGLSTTGRRAVDWLVAGQNGDGGWGDTRPGPSNPAATMLVRAAIHLAGQWHRYADSLAKAQRYFDSHDGLAGLRRQCGGDPAKLAATLGALGPGRADRLAQRAGNGL